MSSALAGAQRGACHKWKILLVYLYHRFMYSTYTVIIKSLLCPSPISHFGQFKQTGTSKSGPLGRWESYTTEKLSECSLPIAVTQSHPAHQAELCVSWLQYRGVIQSGGPGLSDNRNTVLPLWAFYLRPVLPIGGGVKWLIVNQGCLLWLWEWSLILVDKH